MTMTPINLADAGKTIGGLLIIGAIIKNAIPQIPNRFIPLITMAAGTVAYLAQTGDWTAKGVLAALLVSATATGAHSGVKNVLGIGKPLIGS